MTVLGVLRPLGFDPQTIDPGQTLDFIATLSVVFQAKRFVVPDDCPDFILVSNVRVKSSTQLFGGGKAALKYYRNVDINLDVAQIGDSIVVTIVNDGPQSYRLRLALLGLQLK